VKWTNLDYSQCTWETADVVDCPELVAEFHELNKLPSLDYRLELAPPDPSEFRPIVAHKQSKGGFVMRPYQLIGLNFLVNA
jgi:hypothetical protein